MGAAFGGAGQDVQSTAVMVGSLSNTHQTQSLAFASRETKP